MSRENHKDFLDTILNGHQDSKVEAFESELERIWASGLSEEAFTRKVTNAALVNVDIDTPNWTFVSSRVLLNQLYKEAARNRGYDEKDKYGGFVDHVNAMIERGLYTKKLTEWYSSEELSEIGKILDPIKDEEFTYIGLRMLVDRYVASGYKGEIYELPQERFLIISTTLMALEKPEKRLELIKESYWALSNLYMTVATPTLSNSGKPDGQLSSCFIDTVEDSIDGIYSNNKDMARVSKNGGGVGVYMGKVRAKNSTIRKFAGKSSGIIPWIKNLNNTAISVDQEGKRQGAIAIYTDIWHKDVFPFLNLLTNNGDERLKARDIHPGLCVPDLFMELIEADDNNRMLTPNAPWHLFDPHEVKTLMGWSLEDSYDEEEGSGTWRTRYQQCIDHPILTRITVPVKEVVKAIVVSQLEKGHPYMFYRDEVNRKNPNKHEGIIYSSNLCTEIAQSMSSTDLVEEYMDDEGYIHYKYKPGKFVVCNLASLNLGRCVKDGVTARVVRIAMRMLDNVIDMNNLPVQQASKTNKDFRPTGLGTFGWHHALAVKGIQWDSEESVTFADELYEDIAFEAISTSMEIAKEKGAYPLFKGSDWESGAYFYQRGYTDEFGNGEVNARHNWMGLADDIRENGIRNGYWGAVAPNSSTAIIAGSTQGIDPFYDDSCMYIEEKKDFKIRVVAPDLTPATYPYYFKKGAYRVNQHITLAQNAARQRHIDQAISLNLYVPKDIKAKDLMGLHRRAWKSKIKTTYYVHSKGNTVADECEWCQ